MIHNEKLTILQFINQKGGKEEVFQKFRSNFQNLQHLVLPEISNVNKGYKVYYFTSETFNSLVRRSVECGFRYLSSVVPSLVTPGQFSPGSFLFVLILTFPSPFLSPVYFFLCGPSPPNSLRDSLRMYVVQTLCFSQS